jgi:hypothetical protein
MKVASAAWRRRGLWLLQSFSAASINAFAALEDREIAFNAVRVHVTARVFRSGVLHGLLVAKHSSEPV